ETNTMPQPEGFAAGGCMPDVNVAIQSASGGGSAGALGAVGGLVSAAANGQLGPALKSMAISQAKSLGTKTLHKLLSLPPAPKPPKPPWHSMGNPPAAGSMAMSLLAEAIKSKLSAPSPSQSSATRGGKTPRSLTEKEAISASDIAYNHDVKPGDKIDGWNVL